MVKKKGEAVNADEPIVELETDKVNLEVPSPVSGILSEISSPDGETVQVGALLGTVTEKEKNILENNEINEEININKNDDNIINLEVKKEPEIFEEKFEDKSDDLKDEPIILQDEEPLVLKNEIKNNNLEHDKTLSPAVRKIVSENKIDIQSIQGSGKDGRILKGDLINLMGVNPPPSERKIKYGQEERIKMTRLRQTIAKRLKQAQENAALLTTFNEVDMTNIIEMRKQNQDDFQSRYGVKLGFMSFFVKACIVALKNFPAVNAEIEGQEIIYKNYYNISFAVGTDKGLVVPVLKNADELSFADIEKNIKKFLQRQKMANLQLMIFKEEHSL